MTDLGAGEDLRRDSESISSMVLLEA